MLSKMSHGSPPAAFGEIEEGGKEAALAEGAADDAG